MNKDNQHKELVKEWFRYALNDEKNARCLLNHKEGTASHVCFLSQQIAEKSLKALLVFHTGEYPRTHSLETLAMRLNVYSGIADEEKEAIIILDSYYITSRYPVAIELQEFTWPVAEEALHAAVRIKNNVYTNIQLPEGDALN